MEEIIDAANALTVYREKHPTTIIPLFLKSGPLQAQACLVIFGYAKPLSCTTVTCASRADRMDASLESDAAKLIALSPN